MSEYIVGLTEEILNEKEKEVCEEFLKDKKCDLCEQIFNDLLNKTGFYNLIKNPPKLVIEEDIEEFGYEEAVKLAREDFVKPSEGFARCKNLCRKHQAIIRKDNNERNKLGMDIPTDFSLLRIKKSLI